MLTNPKSKILVECVVQSTNDALAAEAAGASRLEVVSAIELGGLTPTLGTVQSIRKKVQIPIRAMVRLRGGSFQSSVDEIEAMAADIEALRPWVDGFVFGVLDGSDEIDEAANKQLIEAAALDCALHRAFDVVSDPLESLHVAKFLGFKTVLTTGQTGHAMSGAKLLTKLVELAGDDLEVLVAGGVRASNVAAVITSTSARAVHLGPFVLGAPLSPQMEKVGFGAPAVQLNAAELREVVRITSAY